MKSQNILLLGLGGMGQYLARRLSHEGHQVTVIESGRATLNRADAELDVRFVQGDAMSFACWTEADAQNMDYLIAVTDDDAVNILSALIADRFGIREKIVRSRAIEVGGKEAVLPAEQLNIDLVIRPEELTAQEIVRLLNVPSGNVLVEVGDGELQVLAARVGPTSPFANMLVSDLSRRYDDFAFRIGCVTRDIDTIVPGGDFQILPGDAIYILAAASNMQRVTELIGVTPESRREVMIVGGGMIGARVAELLESSYSVTLLEQHEHRAEELSHWLQQTRCLHGNGSDREMLLLAGLLHMDAIVAATGNNETNIMTSVLAKHVIQTQASNRNLAAKTIAVTGREAYQVLASQMGTIAVNKKVLAANAVLRHIRRGQVLSVARLHGCDAEVVQLIADADSPITKKPLYAQDALRERITVGAVVRSNGWEVAVGSTQISAGDRVVCVCREAHLGELQRLFLS
jgi:trk system potassium uptake protein TrkA